LTTIRATDALFAQLKSLLAKHARGFKVTDRRGFYALDDRSVKGYEISFGAVVSKAGHVSFYLLSTVWNTELLDGVSADLRALRTRRGGFFNFKTIDAKLLTELAALVARARKQWDPVALAK
jgi:hypothetical protein